MKEKWEPIINYEDFYKVSNTGKILSLRSNKELKQSKDNQGYLQVTLADEKSNKNFRIHRLVAMAFLQRQNNKNQVNHIDENKINNNASNLEWCNSSYNSNYGTRNNRIVANRKIAIKGVNTKTGETITFESTKDAQRNGFHSGHISDCINGKKHSHKGYKWFKKEIEG